MRQSVHLLPFRNASWNKNMVESLYTNEEFWQCALSMAPPQLTKKAVQICKCQLLTTTMNWVQ